ncbi:hypothetical protein LB467_03850 [Salegentibacter sp. JZCK2]|uniref:DUF6733 family protein n=1 Tax=Salegentibacter tibetensis TaxID=2873600 RepID=UPI001CC947DF|nr:DUF6733 family protein [Salegentibacter tibetensis]MBZ9728810.1 hypothetical protein [Salegentibacter tibetensis]
MLKKQTILVLFFGALLWSQNSNAQQETIDKIGADLSLNHDAFFGFNPMMSLSYQFSDTDAFTVYGIQWGAGTASAWGQWTEFGLGYNKTVGNFDINPSLGFTMGSLLSSGAAQEGIIGDGIVPNLTMNYGSDHLEGELYFGYYAALRNNTAAGQSTNNYVHYWVNLGYKFSDFFSMGGHFEELYLSGGEIDGGQDLERADGYLWLGPYLQFQKGNVGLRFSFGGNLADEDARFAMNDFYKLSFFITL